jgi:hypothetical protein
VGTKDCTGIGPGLNGNVNGRSCLILGSMETLTERRREYVSRRFAIFCLCYNEFRDVTGRKLSLSRWTHWGPRGTMTFLLGLSDFAAQTLEVSVQKKKNPNRPCMPARSLLGLCYFTAHPSHHYPALFHIHPFCFSPVLFWGEGHASQCDWMCVRFVRNCVHRSRDPRRCQCRRRIA